MKSTLTALLAICLSWAVGCGGEPTAGLNAEGNQPLSEFEQTKAKAEKGDKIAQFDLGLMYDDGEGVPRDYKEAVKWYRKAAEQGYFKAQHNLGVMYAIGNGVPQDDKLAVKWYRKGAEQGSPNSQHMLGVSYHKGEGVPRDFKEAMKWYRKAAEQGFADAQSLLAESYLKGEGVPQDYVTAYAWVMIAGGNERSKDRVAEEVIADLIVKADALSKEMIKKNPKLLNK